MQAPPKSAAGAQISSEKIETLKQAGKCFDDAIRSSSGKNLMAHLGKARVAFSLGKYGEALQYYQLVLERAPDLIDPDPRIGIGCCLWQLDHKEEAKSAWERALELVCVPSNLDGRAAKLTSLEPGFKDRQHPHGSLLSSIKFAIQPQRPRVCCDI